MEFVKKVENKLKISICDISLFIYISSLISHKLGHGFDAIFCRLTFLFMSAVFAGQFIYDSFMKRDKRILNKQFLFLILFWGFAICSALWALNVRTIIDFNWNAPIQAISISLFLSYRIKSKQDFGIILNIIILSVIYMCALVLVRCPIDAIYERRMGGYVGIHSNSFGRYISFASIISLYLYLSLRKKRYLLLLPIFLVLIILSGSRTSLLLFFAGCAGLILIFSKSKVKILWIIAIIVILIFVIQLTLTNPQLYKLVGWRIEGLINLFNDSELADDSTLGRLYFIQSAQDLFKKNKLLGIGLDNFQYYQRIIGYKQVTYSHSNHWELLSCLGITGHFLYYFIHYYIFCKSIANYKRLENDNKFVFILIILILIVDYIIISYIDVFCQILLTVCYLGCYKKREFQYIKN